MAEDLFAEDFGQRVDLTQRIREVLTNYPEGTTILKELIQNADDARATKVRTSMRLSHLHSAPRPPRMVSACSALCYGPRQLELSSHAAGPQLGRSS